MEIHTVIRNQTGERFVSVKDLLIYLSTEVPEEELSKIRASTFVQEHLIPQLKKLL